MSEPTIDRELLLDLLFDISPPGVHCSSSPLFCTRQPFHAGPCAHACSVLGCSPSHNGTVTELLASLYDVELEWCAEISQQGYHCSRSSGLPHRIHVAHYGPGVNSVCVSEDGLYVVWRTEDSIQPSKEATAAPEPPSTPIALDPLLKMQADRAFRFFAGLDLRDQPLAVQREARDVLQALGRVLRPGEVEK